MEIIIVPQYYIYMGRPMPFINVIA